MCFTGTPSHGISIVSEPPALKCVLGGGRNATEIVHLQIIGSLFLNLSSCGGLLRIRSDECCSGPGVSVRALCEPCVEHRASVNT